jgi:phage terminase large subunit GpA-like protein
MSKVTNQFLGGFLDVARQRFSDDNTKLPMSDWMVKNMRHPKSKATNPKPFSFAGYEFQKKIADDMHPDLSVIKVSQVGLTEIQVRKFLGILKRFGPLTGIFTLPNDEMYERVSKARVGPIVNEEAILNQPNPSKPIRSMALYQIDNSFGYFTGNKESDATSIPADFVFHDELDLSEQSMIALFMSRLNNSTFKVRQKFSTPTYPGFGIDAEYELGDKHEYMLKCDHCNHYQIPMFSPQFVHLRGRARGADLHRPDRHADPRHRLRAIVPVLRKVWPDSSICMSPICASGCRCAPVHPSEATVSAPSACQTGRSTTSCSR